MKGKQRVNRLISWLMAMAMILTMIGPGLPAAAAGTSKTEEAYAIYPIPQSITYGGGTFTLTDTVAIVAENGVDEYTTNFLKEVLDTYHVTYEVKNAVQNGKTNIVLGIQGSGGAADQAGITVTTHDLFEKPDAYVLEAKENCIVIQGKDTDSVYYGVATLQMMFSSFNGEKFLNAHIEDYASVESRGYIEGFYGSWNFEERANLMRFARNYKMNSYVYAAKGDAYHTSKWAELYPEATLNEFRELVKVGKETKVEFAWSIHLGSFFSGLNDTNYETKYNQLTAKLDQLYDIGVRRFDVLNDDFGGGSHETVVRVLNELNTYLKGKGCESITYCPQGYNRAWSGNGSELAALQNLADDIKIYWTGDDVNSPVTQSTIDFLEERSGHQADFWLNYPVNEHASSGIFLGDITYYARDNVTGLAGFHSNPCRYPYASEVALYQLAALVWNNNDYSSHAQEIWESTFDYLQPEVKDSYLTIARNVSNAPNSSRVPGFHESEYLAEKLDAVKHFVETGVTVHENSDAQELLAEFTNIINAVADFRKNCANKDLVKELDPWLKSLDDLAHAGKEALESLFALEENDFSAGWNHLSSASQHYDSMYTYPVAEDKQTTYAKAGSKRLAPFVSSMINAARNQLTPILNPDDDTVTPVFIGKFGGNVQADDTNAKKIYDGDATTFGSWTIVQQAGDYFGLDLGRVITVRDVTILQGQTETHHDIFHDAVLQYSTDNQTWTEIPCTVTEEGHTITADGLNIQARYIRYYLKTTGYNGKPDYWTYVREFTVNKAIEEHDRVYTNVEELKETPLTISGTLISVRDLRNLTLAPGEYVGIRLVDPTLVSGFVKKLSNETGLALQYSYNEQEWTTVSGMTESATVKYLRLINNSGAAVTVNLENIGMNLINLEADPVLLTTTIANGLSEGSYDKIFDGDLSTYLVTGSSQTQGTFMTFDLGKMLEVHDVTAVTTDGAQRFYNAKIQISKDNAEWTDIAVVANDNSVFEVPYRYVRCDGNGAQARYLRIYFTAGNSNKLKLHELQINKAAAAEAAVSEITSSMTGNLEAALDKDISTLFAASAKAGDYLEYRISGNTNIVQVSVLQGSGGKGKVYAETPGGKKLLGTLEQSVSTFDTTDIAPITAVRIEWTEEEEIAIHEISVARGADASDDIGVYVEPIILGEAEPITNLAIGKSVTVSGTSDGNKDYVNDGDLSTKWDSNYIQKGTDNAGQNSWVCIDLGGEKTYEVSQIIVSYFNKIYPTSYKLQVCDDGSSWRTIKELSRENGGSAHPVDTIDLDTPVTARYFRLFFEALNTEAAGNGVGVKEFEIYGREAVADVPVTVTEQQDIGAGGPVEVSGTSNGDKANINDTDTNSKWDSNFIKGVANPDKEAWFYIDLGEKADLIDELKVQYYNKVYPTVYEVQVSNDAQSWTTVKTLSKEHNGSTYPKDEVTFETPVSARYIRMLVTEMNSAAAGNGIGITDAKVPGRYINGNVIITGVTNPATIIVEKGTEFDAAQLSALQEVEFGPDAAIKAMVPVTWDLSSLNTDRAGVYTINGELSLNGVSNPENITAQVKVIVIGARVTEVTGKPLEGTVIQADQGTAIADLGLQENVTIMVADGEETAEQTAEIQWNTDAYDANSLEEQTITGTILLPEGVENPDQIDLTVSVKVQLSVPGPQDLSTGKPVEVSGTSNGNKSYINDTDTSSKWDSNLIKGVPNPDKEAWFYIDLGEKADLIDELKVQYYNKVYPTVYEVQVSNDAQNWRTVKTLSKEHNGPTYPKDEITFETAVSARYIRMLFTEMNSAAAGHGIGITDAKVIGSYINGNVTVTGVINPNDITANVEDSVEMLQLSELVQVELTAAGQDEKITAMVPVTWDMSSLDMETAGEYTLEGTLSFNGISNPQNIKAQVKITVEGHTHQLEKVDAAAATCTEDGNIEYYQCSCGSWFADAGATEEINDHSSVILAALGHDYTEEVADEAHRRSEAANCQEVDTYWYDCSRCDANAKDDVNASDRWYSSTNAGAHDYDTTAWGYQDAEGHAHKCTVCGEHDTVKAHTPNIPEATETEAKVCTECGYVIQSALGHIHRPKKVDATAATCTEDGNKEYYQCSCGIWFTDANATEVIEDHNSVILAALGHDYSEEVADEAHRRSEAANCQEVDTYWYDCSRCEANAKDDSNASDRWYEITNAGAHDYDTTAWGYQDADGHAHKCTVCGVHDIVEAHKPNIPEATEKDAKVCTVCGYVIQEAKKDEGGSGSGGSENNNSGSGSGSSGENNSGSGSSTDNNSGNTNDNNGQTNPSNNVSRPSTNGNKPGTGTTATKPGTGKPYIKNAFDKKGWEAIKAEIDHMQNGDTLAVEMNGSVTVQSDVLDKLKGKDMTLSFVMGNGITWNINGQSITADKISDIDFTVTIGTNAIPEDVIKNVAGDLECMQIRLAHEGDFGFTAVLSIELDKANVGMYANLFYYNEQTGELEFICADEISADGMAEMTFNHASDYAIVIDTDPMDAKTDVSEEETQVSETDNDSVQAEDESVQAEAEAANDTWNPLWMILIVAVVIAVGLGVIFNKKKGSKNQ